MDKMIIKPFAAQINKAMTKESGRLPLKQDDENRLLLLIPEDDYMLLTISDGLYSEYLKVTNQCGVLLVERGQSGSEPHWFPNGSCVKFENSVAVTRWIMCNEDCCDGPCPCDLVEFAGKALPSGKVGVPWEGSFIFKGDTPMKVGVSDGLPSWVSAEAGANYVRLHGIPNTVGSWAFSVTATNCTGQGLAVEDGLITITAD